MRPIFVYFIDTISINNAVVESHKILPFVFKECSLFRIDWYGWFFKTEIAANVFHC